MSRLKWSDLLVFSLLFLAASHVNAAEYPDFTRLVDKYGAAVVNISTTQNLREGRGMEEMIPGFPFFGQPPMQRGPKERKSQSLGSGFIVSADGYVVTNTHVVKDADKVVVRLTDRQEFEAKVIGRDERSDIALLKIAGKDLPVVKVGDPDKLKVGSWVVAIGAPFGFDNSVTAGIVGAKGRSLPNENYVPFIQTDVAVNPGNSGGPLFNMDGEVVGVNSQIYSRTGGYMGISFAIPINLAMQVVDQLRSKGKMSYGWLGVKVQEITKPLAESFKMASPNGALVGEVVDNSPAAKAGVKVGDVVVSFNGKPVRMTGDLPPLVGVTPIGSKAELGVIREGKLVKLPVEVEALPGSATLADGSATFERLGLVASNLTDELRKQRKLKDGVLITEVQDGPAANAGIRPGDVIIEMAQEAVKDLNDFRRIEGELPDKGVVPVLVRRERGTLYIPMELNDK